jgi:hypothetical protein
LRRELERERVVVVAGAGVSVAATRGARAASWVGMLEDGISRCEQMFHDLPDRWADELRGRMSAGAVDDLLFVADEVTRVLGGPRGGEYRRWLREAVGSLEPEDPAIIEALCDLGVPIATTNYDSLIERVTGLESVTWRSGPRVERSVRGDEPGVLHLHGHWEDPESVVLGIHSYGDVLGDAYAQFVPRALSAFNSLLFVGCGEGLKDPNFLALRQWLGDVFEGSEYRHFRLALSGEARNLAAEHDSRERIFVVPYGDCHEDLVPFLRRLRPPHPAQRPRSPADAHRSRLRLWAAAAAGAAVLATAAVGVALLRDEGTGSASMRIGEKVTGEVEPGERNDHSFSADEGQRIFPLNGGSPATGTCAGLDDVSWSLWRDDQSTPLFDQRMNDCSYPSGPEGYDLGAGMYTVVVRNHGPTAASYEFTVVDAEPNEVDIEIGGPPLTGDVERGVTNVYTFDVDSDQAIVLFNQPLDGSCEAAYPLAWSLRRVGGAAVFDGEPMRDCRDPCPRGCTLTKGTYQLVVSGGSEPGRYSFVLARRR